MKKLIIGLSVAGMALAAQAEESRYIVKVKQEAYPQMAYQVKSAQVKHKVIPAESGLQSGKTMVLSFDSDDEAQAFLLQNKGSIAKVAKDYKVRSFGQWGETESGNKQQFFKDFNTDEAYGPTGMGITSALSRLNKSGTVTMAFFDSGHYPSEDMEWYLQGFDFTQMDTDTEDRLIDKNGNSCYDGHGLSVASVAAGIWGNNYGTRGVLSSDAPEVNVLPIRVTGRLDEDPNFECSDFNPVYGWLSDNSLAIDWLLGEDIPEAIPYSGEPVNVINMSLGAQTGECPFYLQEAIDKAVAAGITVVAAAGNFNDDASLYSPGNCDGVVTVGALTREAERDEYSNYGQGVTVSVQGDMVPATLPEPYYGMTYYDANGTSIAAPLVTASVALAALDTGVVPDEVMIKAATNPFLMNETLDCDPLGAAAECLGSGVLSADKLLTIARSLKEIEQGAMVEEAGLSEMPCGQATIEKEKMRILGIDVAEPVLRLPKDIRDYYLESVRVFEGSTINDKEVAVIEDGISVALPNHQAGQAYTLLLCYKQGCLFDKAITITP